MNGKKQIEYFTLGRAIVVAGLISLLLFSGISAQTKKPISKKGLLEALRIGGLTTGELMLEVQQRGVDFALTREIEAELRGAGAESELIRAVASNRRSMNAPVRAANAVANEIPHLALGLVVQDLTPALAATVSTTNTRGVFVSTVAKGSPAEKAGVERRDIITALNNSPINNTEGLRRQVARLRTGEAISFTVLRNGSVQKLKIGDASASENKRQSAGTNDRGVSGKGRLGLSVVPLTPEIAARFRLSNVKGLVVTGVDASGPAATAGIKIGDVIEEFNGQAIRIVADVETALAKTNSGRVRLRINRAGKSLGIDLQPRT